MLFPRAGRRWGHLVLSAFTLFVLSVPCRGERETKEANEIFKNLYFPQFADVESGLSTIDYRFRGYTDHWDQFDVIWYRYAGIFTGFVQEPESLVLRAEDRIGQLLLLEELWIHDGFIKELAECRPVKLYSPKPQQLPLELAVNDVLVVGTDRDSVIKAALKKLPGPLRFRRNRAFYFKTSSHKLFVICSQTMEEAERLKKLISQAIRLIRKYEIYKGIAGYHTGYYAIGHRPENPLDSISKALRLRCSWMLLTGYNDLMAVESANKWLETIKLPFLLDAGRYGNACVMYGMKEYPPQQDSSLDNCIEWAEKLGGYIFVEENHAKKINESVGVLMHHPGRYDVEEAAKGFITGYKGERTKVPPAMLVFLDKGRKLTVHNIFEAIVDKKAVGVFERGRMVGLKKYVEAMWMLLMDRIYLEERFAESADVEAKVRGEDLIVQLRNKSAEKLKAQLVFDMPKELQIQNGMHKMPVNLVAHENRILRFPITYNSAASGRINPVVVTLDWGRNKCSDLAYIELPNPIETHRLLLVDEGNVSLPVTIWNCSEQRKVLVRIEVFESRYPLKPLVSKLRTLQLVHAEKKTFMESLSLEQGRYNIRISALGTSRTCRISVEKNKNKAQMHLKDIDGDGINEIIMENNNIRATVLLTGGRIIEYVLKEKNDNLLFKLWPEKAIWHHNPKGKRNYYPYGGLEEFIGYPTITGHIVFDYQILSSSGPSVSVKVWANVHGNIIEKIFTLYGEGTVLETRYALRNMHPSLNVLGVNPLIELGQGTGLEDAYYFPARGDITEFRPSMKDWSGRTLHLSQGWVAGEDTKEAVSLVVAYPIDATLFMHYWSNHPRNKPTPYYYTELQPWVMINRKTTTYFTYYLLGYNGRWNEAVKQLKNLGLLTFASQSKYATSHK